MLIHICNLIVIAAWAMIGWQYRRERQRVQAQLAAHREAIAKLAFMVAQMADDVKGSVKSSIERN